MVKKLCDDCFVDALYTQSAAVNPLREVGNAAQTASKRMCSVAAFGQILLVSINLCRQWPLGEHVDDVATNGKNNVHDGLL